MKYETCLPAGRCEMPERSGGPAPSPGPSRDERRDEMRLKPPGQALLHIQLQWPGELQLPAPGPLRSASADRSIGPERLAALAASSQAFSCGRGPLRYCGLKEPSTSRGFSHIDLSHCMRLKPLNQEFLYISWLKPIAIARKKPINRYPPPKAVAASVGAPLLPFGPAGK